jgi:hypothetical protein
MLWFNARHLYFEPQWVSCLNFLRLLNKVITTYVWPLTPELYAPTTVSWVSPVSLPASLDSMGLFRRTTSLIS